VKCSRGCEDTEELDMFKLNSQISELLDSLGKLVFRAASGNETAANAAAESPFLFSRIRAAIAEQEALAESGGWLSLFLIARRAVPAMALVTLLTIIPALTLLNTSTQNSTARFDEDTFFDTRGNSLPGAVLATRETLTRDDVFSIVVDRTDRGSSK
jgi:hypothetical protein